jgi:peptidoglycan/xylan/chitin deacetylase (PgdA/CDA1 family)
MDDHTTALRTKQRPRPAAGSPRARGRRPVEPHHRRRRSIALAALAVIALLVGVSAGSGGGDAAHHAAQRPAGYFGQIQALAGNGTRSFIGEEQSAENAAIDRTLAYTPFVRIAGAQHREVALTFDDGPGPYTPNVLSVLTQQNVPATFFQVGALEKYFHDATSQIVARGYPIGDHTQTHAPMSKLAAGDQKAQLIQEISAMGNFGASFPRLFRPPYGLWNATTLGILRTYRMLMVLWTVDTEDYKQLGVPAIVSTAVSGARPGAIILLHDAGGNRAETVAALPQIITELRARGYQLVTVPRLLLDNPAPADQQLPTGLAGAGG